MPIGALLLAGCRPHGPSGDDSGAPVEGTSALPAESAAPVPAPPRPPADVTSRPVEALPAGVVLRFESGGGIGGGSNRLDISGDRLARLSAHGARVGATHLTADEAIRLDALRAQSGHVSVEHRSPPGVADGGYSRLFFDGKGTSPLEREVGDFTQGLFNRVRGLADVWRSELVITGRARDPPTNTPPNRGVQILVTRVLKQPRALGLHTGAVIDVERAPLNVEKSRGRTLCWIVEYEISRDERGGFHGHVGSPLDLPEPAVIATLNEQSELAKIP